MPDRRGDVDVLVKRAEKDYVALRAVYDRSLRDRAISFELRLAMKNLCATLRSILECLAHEIRDKHCPGADPHVRFCFPIFPDARQYQDRMSIWFPGLRRACPELWRYLEGVQPYQSAHPWLSNFSRLDNVKKYLSLVEQTRTATENTAVASAPRTVSGNPGSGTCGTEKIIWVDFKFDGINQSALVLLRQSVTGISKIAADVYRWL
jgi:hypothetical protein